MAEHREPVPRGISGTMAGGAGSTAAMHRRPSILTFAPSS
jgi:hypothetical protein